MYTKSTVRSSPVFIFPPFLTQLLDAFNLFRLKYTSSWSRSYFSAIRKKTHQKHLTENDHKCGSVVSEQKWVAQRWPYKWKAALICACHFFGGEGSRLDMIGAGSTPACLEKLEKNLLKETGLWYTQYYSMEWKVLKSKVWRMWRRLEDGLSWSKRAQES